MARHDGTKKIRCRSSLQNTLIRKFDTNIRVFVSDLCELNPLKFDQKMQSFQRTQKHKYDVSVLFEISSQR